MRKEVNKDREQKVWCWGKDLRILQSLSREDEEWEFLQRLTSDEIGDCFLVSNFGRVFDCDKQELCALYLDDKHSKYVKVSLPQCPEGFENYNVHRLVATAFVTNPEPERKGVVHHIDGNKGNNSAQNLLWATTAEHGMLHSLKNNDLATYCEMVAEMRQSQPIIRKPPLLPLSYEEMQEAVKQDEKTI